jgi:squalene cyclase
VLYRYHSTYHDFANEASKQAGAEYSVALVRYLCCFELSLLIVNGGWREVWENGKRPQYDGMREAVEK